MGDSKKSKDCTDILEKDGTGHSHISDMVMDFVGIVDETSAVVDQNPTADVAVDRNPQRLPDYTEKEVVDAEEDVWEKEMALRLEQVKVLKLDVTGSFVSCQKFGTFAAFHSSSSRFDLLVRFFSTHS